ncbi:MAG TPA: metallophosphoesterase, partial [Clostridiales bacterium]|nr:metallophosphoesterase [Clostridiales bacterium]
MDICKTILILVFCFLSISLSGCNVNQPTSSAEAYPPDEEITFFIASDIHYLDPSLTDGKEAFQSFLSSGDAKHLDDIDLILDAFINDIEEEKPDILIVCGDLTNNGEKESHRALAKKLKTIEETGTSVYIVPGNHDIFNPWARCFESTAQYPVDTICDKGFREIYGDFGYNEAISSDEHTLSYLVAPSETLWLLMLDSNKYKNNMESNCPNADGAIHSKTIPWIKKCLKMAEKNNARVIAVMHHSLLNHHDGNDQN